MHEADATWFGPGRRDFTGGMTESSTGRRGRAQPAYQYRPPPPARETE